MHDDAPPRIGAAGNAEELSRENQLLRSLVDVSRSINQYLRIDELISHIIRRVTAAMNVETASIMLYEAQKGGLVFYTSSDTIERAEKLEEIVIPMDHGIAGSVFRSGRAEIIPDVGKDPRHYKSVDSATEFTTTSMIAVPLNTRDKTIGVLEVINRKQGFFDNGDLNFVVSVAPMIAMALENARIHTELDRAYSELQLIDKGKDDVIKQTTNEIAFLRRELGRQYRFDQVVGKSEPMMGALRLAERAIDSDITVLIEGETGTGKELIARIIHFNGPRKAKPFVAQNCGGIPDTLLGSELFGHKRGAYTGAITDKKGLFEIANGGTVFLDEVADMSPAMQMSLLRTLQEGEVKALGSELSKMLDIRVISATNRSLGEEVREGRFREDLFYRLSVFTITVPPLRERPEDIPLLAEHFVRKAGRKAKRSIRSISPEAMECLSAYPFPGNVRELENEIERATAMVGNETSIEIFHLSDKLRQASVKDRGRFGLQGSLKEMVEALERSVLSEILAKHGGNKSKVARALGLSRYGLMKKLQRYGF
jgi:transcriptional regulator with GAF, ATPase, and Fis domain